MSDARFRLLRYDSLPSTNDEALRLAAEGAADRTAVLALSQTQGRGRRGRVWEFIEGNLALSVIVDGGSKSAPPGLLSLAVGVAVAETCDAFGIRAHLKWPNDILIGKAKLGGILIEAAGATRYVVGIGLNVLDSPAVEGREVAALAALLTPAPSLETVVDRLAPGLMRWADAWQAGEPERIRDAWLARAHGLGHTITLMNGIQTFSGIFHGIAEDGALLLQASGSTRRFHAGEIASAAE